MEKTCISVLEMGRRLNIARTAAYALVKQPGFYPGAGWL